MRIACLGFVTLPFEGCVSATKRAGFRRIPEHMRTPFGGGTELRCLVNQLLVVLRGTSYLFLLCSVPHLGSIRLLRDLFAQAGPLGSGCFPRRREPLFRA